MKLHLWHILMGVLVAIAPNCAFAYRIGNTDIGIQTSVREVYDDNITYAENNKRKDYRTDLVLGISGVTEGKTRRLRFNADVTQQLYARFNKFNNLSERFSFDFSQELSRRSSVTMSNDFTHAEEPRSFEDQFGRTGTRYRYYQNNFTATYLRELNKQLSMNLSYNNQYYAPSRNDLRTSNYNSGTLEADYSITSKSIILAVVEFMHRKFEHSISISTNRYAGGFRQFLTPQLYLDMRAGKDFARTSDKQKNNSMFYSGSLVNNIDENTQFNIVYTKQDSSTFYTSEIFRSQRVSISLVRQLLKRFGVVFSGFYGKGDYTLSKTKDTFKGGDVRFNYDLTPHIKANCGFAYSSDDSNVNTRDYIKRVISVGVRGDF